MVLGTLHILYLLHRFRMDNRLVEDSPSSLIYRCFMHLVSISLFFDAHFFEILDIGV